MPTTKTVYHYCREPDFCSIIQTKQLRFSDARCLNDYMEHKLVLDMASRALEERGTNRPAVAEACRSMIEQIESNKINPYVCCFSLNPNSLPQWIAYAEKATGFAIGFNRVKLEELLMSALGTDHAGAGEVEYDVSQYRWPIDKAIYEYLLEALELVILSGHTAILQGLVLQDHFDALWKIAAFIKGPDFAWEKEWRLIAMPREDLRAPDPTAPLTMGQYAIENGERDGREIPFFTFPFSADCITEVHVGRKCRYWGNDALKDLLESNGVHAKVIHSPITFR